MAKGILSDITVEFLKSEFSYSPDTGEFKRLKARGKWKASEIAGSVSKSTGYAVLSIRKRLYLAHRLAWLYVYGRWPLRTIDHINGCKTDNRIKNLRDVEHCENMRNKGEQSNNMSGASGVYWRKREGRWYACAFKGGEGIYLGRFVHRNDAISARKEWELQNPVESTHIFLREGITLNGMQVND